MRAGQRGAVLVTGIVLIVVVALMIATLGFLYVSNLRSSSLHSSSEQAYFAAFSGLERATRVLESPTISGAVAPDVNRVPCASLTGDASVTAVTLVANKGQFTVTGGAAVYPATPVTLNGALNSVATVIPVTTLAALGGYSASGRIMIDRELIDYGSTSNVAATCGTAPCFVGARRGAAGTTAVAHATGTRVGQFECDVQSRGAVPDLANARAARILSQSTQLHEAWAAGAAGAVVAQQPFIVRFQQTTWNNYDSTAINVNVQLNGISMLSYVDGFAVGNPGPLAATQPFVARWNGTNWSSINTGLANVNLALNSVTCVGANDCWMVGAAGSNPLNQRPLIIRWNGAWSQYNANAIGVNQDLRSVYCVSTTECYAVGMAGGGGNRPFTVRYDGTTWADDNSGFARADLFGVHCAVSNDCWAVGQTIAGQQPFTVRWNAGAWTASNNNLAGGAQNLNSVFCVATNDCWAVGDPGGAAAQRPFIVRWNGTAWSVIDTSSLNLNAPLLGIACVNTNDCWAVGNAIGGAEFIIKWNGTTWTRYNDAGAAVANNNLRAVSVLGAAQRAPAARQEVYP
jgi:hypothetical protein